MNDITPIRLTDFTFDEFTVIKQILDEWSYEWLEYDLIHSTDNEKIDVTFHIDTTIISLSDFIRLFYEIGQETVFSGRVK